MDCYIVDKNMDTVAILDGYQSLIWNDRYFSHGDFEIYSPITSSFLTYAIPDYYLWNSESEHMMIIEDISIVTEVEGGNFVSVTGRSLESILDRRIAWEKRSFTDADPVEVIFSLLSTEIENPTKSDRKIANFKHLPAPENLPERENVTLELFGESVLEVIETLCEAMGVGFKVLLNSDNEFVFSLYVGADRSFDQDNNPWVIFSSEYENLVDTSYTEQHSSYKNAIVVKGEENNETGVITKIEYQLDDAVGIDRKEMFVDANDIDRNDANNNPIPMSRYLELLTQRGKDTLESVKLVKTFEGGVETHASSFVLGKDYFLGDIVQITTPTKVESSARITEVIRSYSDGGIDTVPTFSILE